MSELRLILLAAGIVLIIGIYLYTRHAQNKSTARNARRREPRFEAFVSDSDAVPPLASSGKEPIGDAVEEVAEKPDEPTLAAAVFEQADLPLPEELRPEPHDLSPSRKDQEAEAGREKVIVIRVAAKGNNRFGGPAIVEALRAESLEFGDFDIFHRRSGSQAMFSVASMVEPGKFDMDNLEQLSTPGLSLFLLLPGPDSPVAAFTEMLSTARRLASALGGDVLDESGSTLSRQAASHLREQIIEFAHRIR